jgi:hypothetical protein
MLDFLVYLLAGRLLIWFLQTAGLLQPIWQLHELTKEMSQCDLCIGFWVYLGLALTKKECIFGVPLLDAVILAMTASLMAHLIRIGWTDKFGTTIVS